MKERVQSLDAIRGCAIILVVATHALAYTYVEAEKTIEFWVVTVAVPPFFLVDGYLFLDALRKTSDFYYGKYIRKSARRLLLPWLIFTVLYGALRAAFEYKGFLDPKIIVDHDLLDILSVAYYSEISAQMYFLLSLFLIRSWSFVTKFLAAMKPLWIVVIWVGYTISWASIAPTFKNHDGFDPIFYAFWGFQYYLAGMALYVYREVMDKYAWAYAIAAVSLFLALKAIPGASPVLTQYSYIFTVYFMIIACHSYATFLAVLGKYTMGIFLFHAPVVLKGATVIVPPLAPGSELLQYVLVVAVTLGVSLLAAKLCTIIPYGPMVLGEGSKARQV